MTRITMAGFAAVLALTGCATQVDSPDPGPLAAAVRDQLAASPTLDINGEDSLVRVTTVLSGDAEGPIRSELALQQGSLTVGVTDDGDVELLDMAVELPDMDIHHGRIDLTLTNLRLSLTDAVVGQTVWVDGAAHAEVLAELELSWSLLQDDGSAWPLEPQRVGDVILDVDVTSRADGALEADLAATRLGLLYSWSGLVELRDLDLVLTASESR